MPFAADTSVPVERTRIEIETLARKYGADHFSSGWNGRQAALVFAIRGRQVKFTVPLPGEGDVKVAPESTRSHTTRAERAARAVAQEERRRWRCLLLAIKAKLEAVDTGISTFEEEFLAHIVTADGRTVFERAKDSKLLGPVPP